MNPHRKSDSSTTPARQLDIVLAEDIAEIQQLVAGWLEEAGHRVTCAANGREVIRLVREKPFDVLVTDIVMPETDGWDAILAVNRLRPETRVLAISGGAEHMPVDACLRVAKGVGADAVLKKPFNRAQFISALRQVTQW